MSDINDFQYLRLPSEYLCVYNKLIRDLSSLGIRGLKDSINSSNSKCSLYSDIKGDYLNISNIYSSWNMFQIACAAYDLGATEKSDDIINHINYKMSYCCPKVKTEHKDILYSGLIYYNTLDRKPTINNILNSNSFYITQSKLTISPIYTKGHFIAIPEEYTVKTIENSSFVGDWLYNIDLNIDLYTREDIALNGKSYVLWYCEFVIPFNAGIEVIFDL